MRYEKRYYFNMRSKDCMSHLIYSTETTKKWRTEKLKTKKTDMLRIIGEQSGRKGRLWWEGFAEKESFKPGMKE